MEKKEILEIAFYWEDASDTEGARGPASEKSVPFQSRPGARWGVCAGNRKRAVRGCCGRVEFSSVYRVTLRLNTQIRRYHSASRAAKVPPKLTLSLTG